jgi:hypothetical protein
MKTSIDFLNSIGHSDKVYVRCLAPKHTPVPELEARGMTYKDKATNQTKKSTVDGYIDLQTGELYRRYGKNYKPVTDGWGHLKELNHQGYGVYFVVGHGGERNNDITHGSTLFHESDRATLEQQQLEIDRITQEFGKPTAVVKTKKSLHGYWASEIIRIDNLATYQRRWSQYSKCDDNSLADPAQLMRLPGFDHVAWNLETNDFDRIECQLLQLNEVSYSLEQFDRILPALDVDRFCQKSLELVDRFHQKSLELVECDADDRDMRSLAQYLPGYDNSGKWIKAKCPAHNGESSDSLHIDSETGGFICHGGCSSSAVYNASKALAVAAGHRFEAVSIDTELSQNLKESLDLKNGKAPNLFGGELGNLLSIAAGNFNIPVNILNFCLLPILGSRIDARTKLLISPGTNFHVPAIRWCGLVGETGSKKSPVISLLTDPLSRQQIKLYEEYKEKKIDYDAEFSNWKNTKPTERGEQPSAPVPMLDLYFSNFTIEALVDSIQHHPNSGCMLMLDELAQFYKSLDMYRGGKGADRQEWLKIWNGYGIKNNRKSSGAIVISQTSIGILGGIQPETITNMVSGDESQFDGLWNRFSFVGLPQFKTSAFTETPADLGIELDKVYLSLSEQPHQTHWLSIESKPLWEAWHDEIEDRVLSGSTGLIKGTYSKFHGIAGRNALILHRTLAAINKTIPEQLISAAVMGLAIAWTKWELSQTLLQYQILGLTNDPELSRILKFIDKFTGKGSISPRDVRSWWSGRDKPSFDELKKFMAKVVGLGHAIDNEQPIESSKYQIQILANGSHFSHKTSETLTEQAESLRLTLVTDFPNDLDILTQDNGLTVVTNLSHKTESTDAGKQIDDFQKTVTKTVTNLSHNSETAQNGHPVESVTKTVTKVSHSINDIHSNGSGIVVTKVTTVPNKNNLKIGDRVQMGGDIITVEKIEGNIVCGRTDDDSYIGGSIDSVKMIIPEVTEDDKSVTKVSHNSEPAQNGHPVESVTKSVTNVSHNIKDIQSKDSGVVVTKVTTDTDKNNLDFSDVMEGTDDDLI